MPLSRFHHRRQSFGSGSTVTQRDQLGDFVPIDFAHVQAQPNPAARSDIRRKIESIRLRRNESHMIARHRFRTDGN